MHRVYEKDLLDDPPTVQWVKTQARLSNLLRVIAIFLVAAALALAPLVL
jgi:hypothetical protein